MRVSASVGFSLWDCAGNRKIFLSSDCLGFRYPFHSTLLPLVKMGPVSPHNHDENIKSQP